MDTRIEIPIKVIAHVLGATLVLVCGITFWFFGQSIEVWVSPVISVGTIDEIYRDGKIGCFSVRLTKIREAIPLKYSFSIEAELSQEIPIAVYLADHHNFESQSDLVTHKPGEAWLRNYCFEMPATISEDQDIRVTGRADHWRFPRFNERNGRPIWRTVTPIRPFNICAVGKPQDGVCQALPPP